MREWLWALRLSGREGDLRFIGFMRTNLAWVDLCGTEGVVVGTHLDGARCDALGCESEGGLIKLLVNVVDCAGIDAKHGIVGNPAQEGEPRVKVFGISHPALLFLLLRGGNLRGIRLFNFRCCTYAF